MNLISARCLRILKYTFTNTTHICGLGRMFSYKSVYSLDNLYPQSSMKLYTPQFVPENPEMKFSGYIPIEELDIKYSTSSGPGGQNVNRVNTKVDLRFHVKKASWISDDIKEKLLEQNKTKISKEGYLIIRSELTRSQQLNLAYAMESLRTLIRAAVHPGPPPPSKDEIERRRKIHIRMARESILTKRLRSQVKRDRQGISASDFN